MDKKRSPIGIVGAMDEEISAFLSKLDTVKESSWNHFRFFEGTLEGKEVVISKSGVGKVLAAALTQHLIERYAPSFIIFTGVAGALNPEYEIGDIIVSRDLIQYDLDASALGFQKGDIPFMPGFRIIKANESLVESGAYYSPANHKVHVGRILTGDKFVTGDTHVLRGEFGGDAVEMEGASLGLVCMLNKVPFVVVRTISDKADHSATVDFGSFLPEASKNSVGIVKEILKNPNSL